MVKRFSSTLAGLILCVGTSFAHLTSSLKKYAFYNLLINNILYLCVT